MQRCARWHKPEGKRLIAAACPSGSHQPLLPFSCFPTATRPYSASRLRSRLITRLGLRGRFAVQVAARYSPMSSEPRHRVPAHLAAEPVGQRIAVALGDDAGERDRVAADRAGDVAREEIALMRALEPIAVLLQMERVDVLLAAY